MCGIAGLIDPHRRFAEERLVASAAAMAGTLRHRGPDGHGVWVDAKAGIGLGHRRLSIIDLSSAGRQPMTSCDGRFVITYNGEIYNFRELRADLDARGYPFHGHSDTEVLLGAGVDRNMLAGTKNGVCTYCKCFFRRSNAPRVPVWSTGRR